MYPQYTRQAAGKKEKKKVQMLKKVIKFHTTCQNMYQ
jgi:hypothetical protein